MKYKLKKYNFSNKNQSSIVLDFQPKDFCCVGDDVYFLHENGIGKIVSKEIDYDWCRNLTCVSIPDLTKLGSMFYCKRSNSLYISSYGGSQICKINLKMLEFEEVISPDSARRFRDKYLSTSNSPTYVTSDGKDIIWTIRDCHRCFKTLGDKAIPFVGCGKAGFSMSKPEFSKICHPTGITIMEGTICLADSGNNCLRGVDKNSTFNIISDCKDLKKVSYDNRKLYFLSENSIHMLSSEGDKTHLFEVYRVEQEIQSFCLSGKDCLYILEESDVIPRKEGQNN